MRFNWKSYSRTLLMGLCLTMTGIGCSSQQQQQEAELQLEQEMAGQGQAEGAELAEGQQAAYQDQGSSYDSEESEEAISQDSAVDAQGANAAEYADAVGQEETYNTATNNELESLMVDEEVAEDFSENMANEGTDDLANEYFANSANENSNDPMANNAATNEVLNNATVTNELDSVNEQPQDMTASEDAMTEAPAPVAQAGQGLPEVGSKMSYIVQRGETLSIIAQNIYGDREMWRDMANLTGMENPNRIYPGDVVYYQLTEASMAFASAYENTPKGEVSVQSGDTLASIAKNIYGDQGQWKSIWRQNDNISNPDKLEVGQVIYFVNTQAVMAQKELIEAQGLKVSISKDVDTKETAEALEKEVKSVEGLTMVQKLVANKFA